MSYDAGGIPDTLGLEFLGEVEWYDEPYQFDLTGVWVDPETGRFFYVDDVGCSCPSPYEDVTSRGDMVDVDRDGMLAHLSKRRTEARDATLGHELAERIRNYARPKVKA